MKKKQYIIHKNLASQNETKIKKNNMKINKLKYKTLNPY